MKQLGINIGFVTNSSSVVYHVPRELFNNPEIQDFLAKFEIADGFVGEDLWHRAKCATVAVNKEQKLKIAADLSYNEYCSGVPIDTESDDVVVVLGDEHFTIVSYLMDLLRKLAPNLRGNDYN
jgi:hypothetical protein